MSLTARPRRRVSLLLLTAACWSLAACAPTPPDEFDAQRPPVEGDNVQLSSISVGFEGDLIEVPTDEELTRWLNTIDADGADEPPTPASDAWQPFTPPTDGASIIFEPGAATPFDVLEILAYPEGLDSRGEPISVEVHPLCGPQAAQSCQEVSWGPSGVQISSDLVRAAIEGTEYYAIGGIVLPNGDSHPDSFMALLRNDVP